MPISIFINLICRGTFDGGSRKKIKAGVSCKFWTWRVVLSMNYPIEKKINRGKLFMFKPDQLFKIWKVLHNNSVKSLSFPHFDVEEINNSNSCLWKRVYCTAFSITLWGSTHSQKNFHFINKPDTLILWRIEWLTELDGVFYCLSLIHGRVFYELFIFLTVRKAQITSSCKSNITVLWYKRVFPCQHVRGMNFHALETSISNWQEAERCLGYICYTSREDRSEI